MDRSTSPPLLSIERSGIESDCPRTEKVFESCSSGVWQSRPSPPRRFRCLINPRSLYSHNVDFNRYHTSPLLLFNPC